MSIEQDVADVTLIRDLITYVRETFTRGKPTGVPGEDEGWALDAVEAVERLQIRNAALRELLQPIRMDLSCGCTIRIPPEGKYTVEQRREHGPAECDLQRLTFVME
jgi:hypothetical protein